jgi:peptidoglycan/xylan/chitin deacetylase (PgdA/CDA1 family)
MQIEISFDDGTAQEWEIAELLVKYGLEKHTTFFWPVMTDLANSSKGRQSLTQQQKFDIAKTFKIGSHTLTHRLLTRVPLTEARTEIF